MPSFVNQKGTISQQSSATNRAPEVHVAFGVHKVKDRYSVDKVEYTEVGTCKVTSIYSTFAHEDAINRLKIVSMKEF